MSSKAQREVKDMFGTDLLPGDLVWHFWGYGGTVHKNLQVFIKTTPKRVTVGERICHREQTYDTHSTIKEGSLMLADNRKVVERHFLPYNRTLALLDDLSREVKEGDYKRKTYKRSAP